MENRILFLKSGRIHKGKVEINQLKICQVEPIVEINQLKIRQVEPMVEINRLKIRQVGLIVKSKL